MRRRSEGGCRCWVEVWVLLQTRFPHLSCSPHPDPSDVLGTPLPLSFSTSSSSSIQLPPPRSLHLRWRMEERSSRNSPDNYPPLFLSFSASSLPVKKRRKGPPGLSGTGVEGAGGCSESVVSAVFHRRRGGTTFPVCSFLPVRWCHDMTRSPVEPGGSVVM